MVDVQDLLRRITLNGQSIHVSLSQTGHESQWPACICVAAQYYQGRRVIKVWMMMLIL